MQSNYIPWKGYFDLIAMADEFILYDDRQYTRRDWRNRNRIKSAQGTTWLTIPVDSKGRYLQRIDETHVSDPNWAERHWRVISGSYRSATHFADFAPALEALYLALQPLSLSLVNRRFLEAICALLGITTRISWSTDYDVAGGRSERLLNLCLAAGATRYLSGPSARDYLEEQLFAAAGIELAYMDYSGYTEYSQPHPPFEHAVSIVDLLLCTGRAAPGYLKSAARAGLG